MSEKQEQKNEDIREFGQVALNNNRENNRISLLTIIGEIVDTIVCRRRLRPPSMNMCFRSWRRWRTTGIRKESCCS